MGPGVLRLTYSLAPGTIIVVREGVRVMRVWGEGVGEVEEKSSLRSFILGSVIYYMVSMINISRV